MIVSSVDLKKILRPLSPVRTETYQILDSGLILAQDSDAWVIVESPLSGLGDFAVNGKKFGQIVNKLSKDIEITRDGDNLTLKSAKAKIDLKVLSIKTPKIPDVPQKPFAVVDLATYKKLLAIAAGSASPNKSLSVGGVVQWQSLPLGIEDTLPPGYRLVGSDGQVGTIVTNPNSPVSEFKLLLNLEAAAVVQIMDGETLLAFDSEKSIILRSGKVTVFASKRDETDPKRRYPNFDNLLANPPKLVFQFQSQDWAQALRTVEPLMDESVDKGGVTLHLAEGVVVFKTVGVGDRAEDEAPYEQITPDPIFDKQVTVSDLRINAKYTREFLAKAGPESTMSLTDKKTPVRLESGEIITLMMPMIGTKEMK